MHCFCFYSSLLYLIAMERKKESRDKIVQLVSAKGFSVTMETDTPKTGRSSTFHVSIYFLGYTSEPGWRRKYDSEQSNMFLNDCPINQKCPAVCCNPV